MVFICFYDVCMTLNSNDIICFYDVCMTLNSNDTWAGFGRQKKHAWLGITGVPSTSMSLATWKKCKRTAVVTQNLNPRSTKNKKHIFIPCFKFQVYIFEKQWTTQFDSHISWWPACPPVFGKKIIPPGRLCDDSAGAASRWPNGTW